jgi:hypothetical protein
VVLRGDRKLFLRIFALTIVSLVLESVEDASSITRFGLVCDEVGDSVSSVDWQAVSSPARVGTGTGISSSLFEAVFA